jgi:hypothetical protein
MKELSWVVLAMRDIGTNDGELFQWKKKCGGLLMFGDQYLNI